MNEYNPVRKTMQNNSLDERCPKILIIKNDHLGDLILITAIFRELKKEYPNSKISVIVSKVTKPIIEKNKNVDEIIVLEAPKKDVKTLINYFKISKLIRKQKFDIGIDMRGGLFTTFSLLFITGIKKRIAPDTFHKINSFFLTNLIKIDFFKTNKHETEESIYIINQGLNLKRKNYMPEIITDREDELIVKKFIKKNNLKKFICICPIATVEYKQWNPKNYEEIVKILKKLNMKILILGINKDKEILEQIAKQNKNCVVIIDFNIRQLSILLKKSRLVISNDGGVMHIAWVSGAKLIAIFAKYPEKYTQDILDGKTTSGFLEKVFPLKNSTVIQSKGDTINDIKVEQVKKEIEKILKIKV